LERARAAYEALLEATPEHANLLGLLGVVALQQGCAEQAEALLRRALAAESDARMRLRNLNNLIALLRQTGRRQAAEALLTEGVPDWPEGVEPDAAERDTVQSLGWALLLLGQGDLARKLVEQAIPDPEGDAGALALAGRLELELGDPQTALGQLERAAELMPEDCDLHIGIGYALHRLGQRDAARAKAKEIARNWAVFSIPPRRSQRADVLVLNTTPGIVDGLKGGLATLHFSGNFASQLVRDMQDEFRFHSAFGDIPPEALPDCAPSVGVVLNNCVNGETMNLPGRLERALHAVRWAGRPVINHPEAIAATTRQKTAELLRGIPGLKVPRIARYQIGPAAVEDILADIESRFGYPVIVRLCQAHRSADHQHSDARLSAVLAHDRAEARAALANLGAPEIYALEYVPLQKKSGHFRKIRALLAEDEIVCAVPGFYNTWMVSGARRQATGMAFYRAHPETVEESRRIVLEPESVLGVDCLRVLETVRDRMPLDFFGIDFDVDDEGQVVFFEANAAMNLLKHSGDPEDIALPDAPFERIKAAFRRAVDRRIGASA
jgi:hypothetical protein